MASLQLRPRHRFLTYPSRIRFFCTSSSSSTPPKDDSGAAAEADAPTSSKRSFSSYFTDVKASLRHDQQRQDAQTPPVSERPTAQSQSLFHRQYQERSSKINTEEIRKSLSEFSRRSAIPPPTGPDSVSPSSNYVSFQEIFQRNHPSKPTESAVAPSSSSLEKASDEPTLDAIRKHLRRLGSDAAKPTGKPVPELQYLSALRSNVKLKPDSDRGSTSVVGGTGALPSSVFGKEMREMNEGKNKDSIWRTEFVKTYSYDELGEKLKRFRPGTVQNEKEGWFSLAELNERLAKLREMEEEAKSTSRGLNFGDLRESVAKISWSIEESNKKTKLQRLDILGPLGATPNYLLQPPKEHLFEKYFHPDNMSASEKMKIELAKVREDFKMSESDCGSARVQVAQLTTKIKYLSSVLSKKDKHSRKGLQTMVQRRKKLLKYLRRTDWESYCLVLDKLGLRDNPELKS